MNTAAQRKGWCPSLSAPMEAGDGLLVRLTPPPGGITAAQAHALSDAAERFGTGRLGLTGRAKLQIRGLRPETHALFAAAMVDLGLASPDPAVERRRAMVTLPPLLDRDPALAEMRASVLSLAADLIAAPTLDALPDKFGVVLDCGGLLPLDILAADIRIGLGAGGARIGLADRASAPCAPQQAAEAVRRLLALCADPPRRMREAVAALGSAQIFAAAGLEESAAAPPRPLPQPIGFLPVAGDGQGAFGLGAPFGLIDVGRLAALADLAQRHGDGRLRPTPWRTVVIAGVDIAEAPALAQAGAAIGLIADPADPRRRVATCVGRPACASAAVNSLAMAERIARALMPNAAGDGAVAVHVAGCAKGCAHPGPAAVVLVGEATGAGDRFALVRRGRAGDVPLRRDMRGAEAVAAALAVLEEER